MKKSTKPFAKFIRNAWYILLIAVVIYVPGAVLGAQVLSTFHVAPVLSDFGFLKMYQQTIDIVFRSGTYCIWFPFVAIAIIVLALIRKLSFPQTYIAFLYTLLMAAYFSGRAMSADQRYAFKPAVFTFTTDQNDAQLNKQNQQHQLRILTCIHTEDIIAIPAIPANGKNNYYRIAESQYSQVAINL